MGDVWVVEVAVPVAVLIAAVPAPPATPVLLVITRAFRSGGFSLSVANALSKRVRAALNISSSVSSTVSGRYCAEISREEE